MSKNSSDIVILIGTANGSGSQTANQILVKSCFRSGLTVAGKNLFPSNIQGLPTWYSVRVNNQGWLARRDGNDIVVALNPDSYQKDLQATAAGGLFFYDSSARGIEAPTREDISAFALPIKDILKPLGASVKLRKLLANMVYVGVLARWIGLDQKVVTSVISDMFESKQQLLQTNLDAFLAGWNYACSEQNPNDQFVVPPHSARKDSDLLIDGNTAAGLGAVYGGCQFLAWYPITPSSSLAESFISYANQLRIDESGKKTYAVIQAEDELSAISMVIGAGWSGARSMTATSGPGVSLMAEAAGLSYFAEIPAVIWDVQRAGPSTGLPTRTMQGDVLSAAKLSHGDTNHILLFPANPKECFEMARTAFDLSEQLQTLVIVLSDLDLGMNFWESSDFEVDASDFHRGKVLSAQDLESKDFKRYADVDGDGIPFRTLPGTEHSKAAYFTRGTGHDESAKYSEDGDNYVRLLDRLTKKYETAKKDIPPPVLNQSAQSKLGVIAFGSSDPAVVEAQSQSEFDYLRLRGWPCGSDLATFLDGHQQVYIVEQNRDAQMRTLISEAYPTHAAKLRSILSYDGLPLTASKVLDGLLGDPS